MRVSNASAIAYKSSAKSTVTAENRLRDKISFTTHETILYHSLSAWLLRHSHSAIWFEISNPRSYDHMVTDSFIPMTTSPECKFPMPQPWLTKAPQSLLWQLKTGYKTSFHYTPDYTIPYVFVRLPFTSIPRTNLTETTSKTSKWLYGFVFITTWYWSWT